MSKIIRQKSCIERIESNGLDKSLLKKKGNSKTLLGWILARRNDYRKQGNFEMALVMETIYKKGLEFQTSEKVVIYTTEKYLNSSDLVEIWKKHQ